MRQKKRGSFLKIVLIALAALVVAAGAVAYWQRDNIKSLIVSFRHSDAELMEMIQANESATEAIIDKLPVNIRPLSQEEKDQIQSGELTESDVTDRILNRVAPPPAGTASLAGSGAAPAPAADSNSRSGTGSGSNSNSNSDSDPNSAADPARTSDLAPDSDSASQAGQELEPVDEEEARIAELIAKIYVLRGSMLGKLEGLANQAKAEYGALTEEQRTSAKKREMASDYLNRGLSLEAQSDASIEAILAELSPLIAAKGGDTGIVSEIREAYAEEKSLKKSYFISTYS